MTQEQALHSLPKKQSSKELNTRIDKFSIKRMRRLRQKSSLRDLIQENMLSTDDLIYPIFVEEDIEERTPIASLPGIYRETEKSVAKEVKRAWDKGIKAVMLFGVSHHKDFIGSNSLSSDGLLSRMIANVKDSCPDITLIADVCFCEYTDHGHCGPLTEGGDVDNDRTIENLALQSIIAAEAGADIVAPSGMMDGMVLSIRNALDESGNDNVAILSYAAKYASAFYGPFRDAAGCSLGENKLARKDRKTYQMNPANSNEALREVEQDLKEGADIVIVKPGLPYLDIIYRVKDSFSVPTFAYNVSGEYAMLKAAAELGSLDYETCLIEMLTSFKRAGADGILTYASLEASDFINNQI
jgi:porphobilinogen synthase